MGTGKRVRAVMAALALLAGFGVSLTAPPAVGSGTMSEKREFSDGEGGLPDRPYYVFLPAPGAADGPTPLVVALHGCSQGAEDFALGARLNEAAAARGMAVVYPEQVGFQGGSFGLADGFSDGNNSGCWNWFRPEHQHAGAGEPGTIAAITRHVISELAASRPVDPRRVYVTGVSAGADMATIMAATHPDLFAAVGVLSGCAYATCTDTTGTLAYGEMRTAVPEPGVLDPMPAFIAQGSTDMVNNAAMDQTALRQWLGTNDLIDDGAPGSVSPVPDDVTPVGPSAGQPGSGDACVTQLGDVDRLPCAGGVLGLESYPYSVERYGVDAGGRALVEHWLVHGLNHAIPDGDPAEPWTDPVGPNLVEPMLDFFLSHPKPSTEVATALEFTPESATAGQYTDDATIAVRLADATGTPVGDQPVTVELAGDSQTVTTDGNGLASATFGLTAVPGTYDATARFPGAGAYAPAEATAMFRVDREDTTLTLTATGKGVQRQLTARLADADTPATGIRRRTVTFMADGMAIGTAETDGDGIARLDVPPAYRGASRAFTAAFAGDDHFLATESSATPG